MGIIIIKPMMKSITKKLLNGLAYHATTEKLVANKLPSQQELSAALIANFLISVTDTVGAKISNHTKC